ncbi:MAG TPA: ferredoxin [Thermodesulfobacteriota bacterium]|nr:ferredoxin [Thermodesulfobacteriota bacterium]
MGNPSNRYATIPMMHVTVDEELCTGFGHCEDLCPEVFKVVAGKAVVLADPVPADAEKRVYRAVEMCPRQALSLT